MIEFKLYFFNISSSNQLPSFTQKLLSLARKVTHLHVCFSSASCVARKDSGVRTREIETAEEDEAEENLKVKSEPMEEKEAESEGR